ncbi:MAG: hypothetical protein LBP70_00555 [Mycoplasmataceae bacterium]|nr:hypothetical protein [Mycoplasmataceae bacterium]
MENNKIKKIKHNNKWFKITATSIAIGLVGVGGGVGVGYGIWYHADKNLVVPTLTLKLRSTHNTTTLTKAGDTLIYDLEPNIPFSNFTGTGWSIPDIESINRDGWAHDGTGSEYVTWWPTDNKYYPYENPNDVIKDNTRSGIFWNDPNDLSQGAFVRISLIKDYDGQQMFFPLSLKITLHDNNDKLPDASASISFVVAKDDDESTEIDDGIIRNVSTREMGMNIDTTPTEIVEWLHAANVSLTGEHTLDDSFISSNINANQFAAILFLEANEIQKNVLVNLTDKYQYTPYNEGFLPNWDNYSIDVRIDHLILDTETDGNKCFDLSFEQDVQTTVDGITNYFPSYNDHFYGYFGGSSNMREALLSVDLPSAWYVGDDVQLSNFVSSWSGDQYQQSLFPKINKGESMSQSLSDDKNIIEGNLNFFYCTPFEPSYYGQNSVPFTQIDFTPEDIARLFWPNVTWSS